MITWNTLDSFNNQFNIRAIRTQGWRYQLFFVNLINSTFGNLNIFKVCSKGECIIRTYFGKPIG